MARHTFFSFHYERDAWRASQVRNSWVTQDRDAAGFWDKAKWEEVKKKGEAAIHAWIDEQLKGTSVTVVLIGAETSTREYVDYEILQSHKKKNGMLGTISTISKITTKRSIQKAAILFPNGRSKIPKEKLSYIQFMTGLTTTDTRIWARG
jgi:hypothetical protein